MVIQLINKEFISKPIELAKMSVPSLAYALQNVDLHYTYNLAIFLSNPYRIWTLSPYLTSMHLYTKL